MHSILEFMGKDHDRLDGLFEKFKSARNTDMNKARRLFHDFKIGLQRHIVWEEEILFPIFEDKAGMRDAGPTEVMRTEHIQIKGFLEKIHNMLMNGDNKPQEMENELKEILTEHNNKEESILYPWIDSKASKQEIKAAFEKIKDMPSEKYDKCCNGQRN